MKTTESRGAVESTDLPGPVSARTNLTCHRLPSLLGLKASFFFTAITNLVTISQLWPLALLMHEKARETSLS